MAVGVAPIRENGVGASVGRASRISLAARLFQHIGATAAALVVGLRPVAHVGREVTDHRGEEKYLSRANVSALPHPLVKLGQAATTDRVRRNL